MRESASTDLREPQGSNPLGPPGLDLEELQLELHLAIGRLRQRPRLIRSFFEGAGLPIENFPSFCNA